MCKKVPLIIFLFFLPIFTNLRIVALFSDKLTLVIRSRDLGGYMYKKHEMRLVWLAAIVAMIMGLSIIGRLVSG